MFERQSRFASIITFCVIIFGLIHVLSYWHKHAKSFKLTIHDSDHPIDHIIDLSDEQARLAESERIKKESELQEAQ